MTLPRFTGSITALATPFDEDGSIAVDDLNRLVESQIEAGIDALLPVGTTGESPTLDHAEHEQVIDIVLEATKGRIPVIAGAGSNSTREAVKLTEHAHKVGADGILHVTGYYNKPSQEGMFRHFCAVADATDKPIVLYSIPGRCVVDIAVETVERLLARYPHVCHLKESGGSVDRVDQLKQAMGDSLTILSGDDGLTLPFIAAGAEGVISVASNVVPREVVELVKAARSGNLSEATKFHQRLVPFFKALFVEPSPAPVKTCLKLMGIFESDRVRLPLCELSPEGLSVVTHAFNGIVNTAISNG